MTEPQQHSDAEPKVEAEADAATAGADRSVSRNLKLVPLKPIPLPPDQRIKPRRGMIIAPR